MKEPITRRDFLLAAAGVAVGLATAKLAGLLESASAEKIEYEKLLLDIISYRAEIGLTDLPPNLIQHLKIGDTITPKSNETEVNVYPQQLSFALLGLEMVKTAFGSNYYKFVKGIINDPDRPELTFDLQERICRLTNNIHNQYDLESFKEVLAHELLGHGSDFLFTNQDAILPLSLHIKAEHGKWRALRNAFAVEGQFLNHPQDLKKPELEVCMGRSVAESIRQNQNIDSIISDMGVLENVFEAISISQGKNIADIKFNKSACKLIGSFILRQVLVGGLKLNNKLQSVYSEKMDNSVLIEIYAEMVRYSLLHPDLLSGHPEILDGITEAFAVFSQSQRSIQELSRGASRVPEAIVQRYRQEVESISSLISVDQIKPESGLTAEESRQIQTAELERQRLEQVYQNYWNNGLEDGSERFSFLSENDRFLINRFRYLRRWVIEKYPTSADRFGLDQQFDPLMDIWDIEQIQASMNETLVRQLWNDPVSSPSLMEEVAKRVEVLQNFVNSPDF